jgi:YHS domain-containing protein
MKKQILLPIMLVTLLNAAFGQHEIFLKSDEAIQGYDPVAYFKEAKPVKGKKEFAYQWKEGTWLFSSKENLQAFEANPEKYSPQFGGYCAYGMSEGHKAPTDPEAWAIVDGKLYLNYNKDVQKLWKKDQQTCIKKANENWPSVKHDKD